MKKFSVKFFQTKIKLNSICQTSKKIYFNTKKMHISTQTVKISLKVKIFLYYVVCFITFII